MSIDEGLPTLVEELESTPVLNFQGYPIGPPAIDMILEVLREHRQVIVKNAGEVLGPLAFHAALNRK